MLAYPSFPSDFDALKSVSDVVNFWIDLSKARERHAVAKAQQADLQMEVNNSDAVLIEECRRHCSKYLQDLPKTYEERIKEVASILTRYQTLRDRGTNPVSEEQKRREALKLLQVYTSLDHKQLEEDVSRMVQERETDRKLSDRLKSANGSLASAKGSVDKIEAKVSSIFKELPPRWRDRKLKDKEDREKVKEFCLAIVESFVKDWKDRSRNFRVPVTIYGTDISTLPEKERKAWSEAYEALGLDKLPKNPVYQHLAAPKQIKPKQQSAFAG